MKQEKKYDRETELNFAIVQKKNGKLMQIRWQKLQKIIFLPVDQKNYSEIFALCSLGNVAKSTTESHQTEHLCDRVVEIKSVFSFTV